MNLFTADPRQAIVAIEEAAIIRRIKTIAGAICPPAPHGIGDDCAVMPAAAGNFITTIDAVVYGRHFDDSASPEEAGAKLVKRNLSDIAAMGGHPGPALLALTVGPNLSRHWLDAFVLGVCRTAAQWGVSLVGGDITSAGRGFFAAHWTQFGSVERPLLRSGAGTGDRLFVTGKLGGSILGHHLTFSPKVFEGLWLAQHNSVTSCIDLTDGLAKDLKSLIPEGCAATIDLSGLPLSAAALQLANGDNQKAVRHALSDGEDYELLFTLSASAPLKPFCDAWFQRFGSLPHHIGSIIQVRDTHLTGQVIDATTERLLTERGFEHFHDNQ